jgi:hypothetical protein
MSYDKSLPGKCSSVYGMNKIIRNGTVEERNVWQDEIEEGTNQIVLNKR